jgi:hypothetical protein
MIVECIDQDFNPIVRIQITIPGHLCSDNPSWLGVKAYDTDAKIPIIVQQPYFGTFLSRFARLRSALTNFADWLRL